MAGNPRAIRRAHQRGIGIGVFGGGGDNDIGIGRMSAIAGAVRVDGGDMQERLLGDMIASAARRGFDGATTWRDGPAGLIRFAHATTPEAVGETQPLPGDEPGSAMLLDGRLDNRRELLALLGRHGAALARAPDVAIALALHARFGDDFVKHLVGDFAVALWQGRRRRLFLARSPFGWRPLLWSFAGGTFAFATEPRTLVRGLGLDRTLNEGAIGEFLSARFISQTDTFWQQVNRLPQGNALALENGRVRQWHWHDGPFEDLTALSAADHVTRFRDLFDQALASVNRSSTPLSSQLSGGLDSSSIVCRATELYRAGKLERPVSAISARFPGEPHDESEYSGAVEAHLGITAKVVGATPFDPDTARQWAADSYQLPLRPNVLDTMAGACARLRGEGERVMLTGEGGDDWLNGSLAHWPDLIMRGRLGRLWRDASEQWPDEPFHVVARRALFHGGTPLVSPRHRRRLLRPHLDYDLDAPDWLRPDWAKRIDLEDRWRQDALPVRLPGVAQKMRYGVFSLARRHVNVDNALAFTESHGIELRHPFHDLRLTQFYMGASGSVLRKDGQKKYILREAMRGTLPEMVRTRTTKAAFVGHTVDAIATMFRQRPPEDMISAKLGWIDPARIRQLHAGFQAWRDNGSTGPFPATAWAPVWFAVSLDIWLEQAAGI
jgi:asparagine synthase (glutamine-hydrolysing)